VNATYVYGADIDIQNWTADGNGEGRDTREGRGR